MSVDLIGTLAAVSGFAVTALYLSITRGTAYRERDAALVLAQSERDKTKQLRAALEAAEESINEMETVFIASGGDPRRALSARARRIRVLRETGGDLAGERTELRPDDGAGDAAGGGVRGRGESGGVLGLIRRTTGRDVRHLGRRKDAEGVAVRAEAPGEAGTGGDDNDNGGS